MKVTCRTSYGWSMPVSANSGMLVYRVRNHFIQMLRYLGISKLEAVPGQDGNDSGAFKTSVVYMDGVPDGVKRLTDGCEDMFYPFLKKIGASSIELVPSGLEMDECRRLWSGESAPDRSGSVDAGFITVKDEARAIAPAEKRKNESEARTASVEKSEVAVPGDPDLMMRTVYESMAEMLPVEGRDYILNATAKDDGVVRFDPKALTAIGKIWLDYLAANLGEYVRNRKTTTSNDETTGDT